ncbi:MAG: hypothetical protein SFU25_00245 [Candidatus Caenarcaniphilales bacterium]|nr:hypothetical protein [Candidatus Caenarcaniphilales bacterium]
MDNFTSAYTLFKLTERHRDYTGDYLVKTNAPNAKDLCAKEVNFASVVSDLENKSKHHTSLSRGTVSSMIDSASSTVPIRSSTREKAIDLSQSYLTNLAMLRLINHVYKQNRAVNDNFRPNG